MKIQNMNLAGAELTLRWARDRDGNQIVVRGDAKGVFDVPERDGQFLLSTHGWSAPREASPLDDVPAMRNPPQNPPRIKPPQPKSNPVPSESSGSAPAEGSGEATIESPGDLLAHLDKITTKKDAMAFGTANGVKLTDDMKLAEMKERIFDELTQEEDDGKGEAEGKAEDTKEG